MNDNLDNVKKQSDNLNERLKKSEQEKFVEDFNKYYPPGQRFFLNAMIKEGYEQGINSYGGKLGKIR